MPLDLLKPVWQVRGKFGAADETKADRDGRIIELHGEGKSQRAIAEEVGVSVATMKRVLARSRHGGENELPESEDKPENEPARLTTVQVGRRSALVLALATG